MGAYLVIVSDLYKVVKLYIAMNYRGTHYGTVHTGVGSYFHIVLDNGNAYLGYFLITVLSLLESESVSTNYTAGMQNTALAYAAVMVHYGIRIYLGVFTH